MRSCGLAVVSVCVVVMVMLLGAAPGLATPIRIMPLGDSLTRGLNCCGNVPGGYRTRLYNRLTTELYPVDFVGSESDNPDPGNLADPDHEGHGGYRIDEIAGGISGWLAAANPAVVLVHLGTNDVAQDFNLATAPNRLDNLISTITTLSPATYVVVAQIISSTSAGEQAQINAYNAAVPGIVAAHAGAGEKVSLVNMNAAVALGDFVDTYHPGEAGYDSMADAWFSAISSLGAISNPPPLPGESIVKLEATSTFSETAYTPSTIDLIDETQLGISLASATHVGYTAFNGSSADTLTDGETGAAGTNPGTAFDLDGTWTSTYAFDTSVNTLGYDINQIQSIAGWSANRAGQNYQLAYSSVLDPGTFIALGTFSLVFGGSGSSLMTLSDPTGHIATGVHSLRFSFSGANGAVYRELDVFGVPTLAPAEIPVPEPSTLALLGLGGIGLVIRRRSERSQTTANGRE